MPINGITSQDASLPLLGRIRKGAKKTVANKPGADTDHFRLDTSMLGKYGESITQKFEQVYGDNPQRLNVMLPFPTIEQNLDAWMEEYTASALVRQCDGNQIVRWLSEDKQSYCTDPIPCMAEKNPSCKCAPHGRLNLLLPDILELGYFQLITGSKYDLSELSSNLKGLQSMFGRLQGLPLMITRVPRQISAPTSKGRLRREKWLLRIELNAVVQQSLMANMQQKAIEAFTQSQNTESPKALPDTTQTPKTLQLSNSEIVARFSGAMLKTKPEDRQGKYESSVAWVRANQYPESVVDDLRDIAWEYQLNVYFDDPTAQTTQQDPTSQEPDF